MSVNRENVIWQSADGTWSRGFFEYYETKSYDDEDYDFEWDVEYTENFRWVSAGHPTAAAAQASWRGANPGTQTVYEYSESAEDAIAEFDLQAALLARKKDAQYFGPRKVVPLGFIAEQVYGGRAATDVSKLRGYSAVLGPEHGEWEADLADRLPTATKTELREVARQAKAHP